MPIQVQTGVFSHLLHQSLKYSYLAEVMRLRLHTKLGSLFRLSSVYQIVEFHDAEILGDTARSSRRLPHHSRTIQLRGYILAPFLTLGARCHVAVNNELEACTQGLLRLGSPIRCGKAVASVNSLPPTTGWSVQSPPSWAVHGPPRCKNVCRDIGKLVWKA